MVENDDSTMIKMNPNQVSPTNSVHFDVIIYPK